MELILFASLLLAVASGAPVEPIEATTEPTLQTSDFTHTNEADIEAYNAARAKEFRKWVGDDTLPEEVIAAFFDLNITLPFTPEKLAAYKEWSAKWGVDTDIEKQSNKAMEVNVQEEALRRTMEIFARIGARAALLDEFTQTGDASEEAVAKFRSEYAAIEEKSSIYEKKLVYRVGIDMTKLVAKEWGVAVVEGLPDTEDEEGPEEQQNPEEGDEPEVKGDDNESNENTEGDDEDEEEATTNDPEQKPEEEENEQKPEEENNEADETTTAPVIEEDEEATTNEAEQKPEEEEDEQKPEEEPEVAEASTEPTPEVVTEVPEQETKDDGITKVEETPAVIAEDEKKGDDEAVDNKTN